MIFAQYSDGATYRVAYDAGERKTYLQTTDGGFMDVPYLVNGAEFVRFDFQYQPPSGLRSCDVAENIGRLREQIALLAPPPKPAASQQIFRAQPEDFRLHVEEGGDSFSTLQEAGARAEMEYRADRQRARREALAELNQPDLKKLQEIRRLNNAHAQQMRPRGGGQFIVRKSGD